MTDMTPNTVNAGATDPNSDACPGEESKMPVNYLMTKKGYLHPMKTYIYIDLLIIGVITALWFVLGISPKAISTISPGFAFGAVDMYFHSIAIAIAALAVYLVIMTWDLDRCEPNIDFPIAYRALMASVFGVVGAVFYLRPIFQTALWPLPLGLIFLGLVLLGDVGGALMIQLYLLPGKRSGTYDSSENIMGMIPKWKYLPSWKDFQKMDATYWLTFVTVIGTFIAGMIGFVSLWLNYVVIDMGQTPAIMQGYIAWMGGATNWLNYTVGSHSHVIGMTVILGVVAVTAKRFKVLDLSGFARKVAKFGMWVSGIGICVMVAVFLLECFSTVWPNATPPLLFASTPGTPGIQLWSVTAANGMAGDDSTMFLASAGAMIMLVPLFMTKIHDRPVWKDPIRASILVTWIFAYIATPIEGFYIEFHEATMHGYPVDLVFGQLQYFALFGITMITMAFLAVDYFQNKDRVLTGIAAFGVVVTSYALLAGFLFTYFNPGTLNADGSLPVTPWGYAFSAGLFLMSIVVLAAMLAVYFGVDERLASPSVQRMSPLSPTSQPGTTSEVAAMAGHS
jgi:hypothetical protein